MIGCDGVRNMLKHYRLARFGRCHEEAALAFTDGSNDIDDAPCQVFFRLDVALERERFVWEQGRQVFKQNLVLGVLRRVTVYFVDFDQREVALPLLGSSDLAFNGIAGMPD